MTMERWLAKYSQLIYALMRVMVGLLFACHGAQKLFGAFGATPASGDMLMLVGGVIEFGGGILVAIGLWAGPAAFISSGEMAVAYFKAHASGGFWPVVNHGELALLYCFLFLYIAAHGSGACSVEQLLVRRRPPGQRKA
jgi:putative oxidoreductase